MTWALPSWMRAQSEPSDHVLAAGVVAAGALALVPAAITIVVKAAIFGFVGWAIEAVYETHPRWSRVFGSHHVPFLPVYAFGGFAVLALAPHLSWLPFLARGATYAASLTALEWVACRIDRSRGHCSWDYEDNDCASGGCIDTKHAVAWGALGLLVERMA